MVIADDPDVSCRKAHETSAGFANEDMGGVFVSDCHQVGLELENQIPSTRRTDLPISPRKYSLQASWVAPHRFQRRVPWRCGCRHVFRCSDLLLVGVERGANHIW